MDKEEKMSCGCDCDNCKTGDHNGCGSGMCTWKGKVSAPPSDQGGTSA